MVNTGIPVVRIQNSLIMSEESKFCRKYLLFLRHFLWFFMSKSIELQMIAKFKIARRVSLYLILTLEWRILSPGVA